MVAIDGTYLDVPDESATRARLGKGSSQYATSGYPQICLVALVACGTRAVIDAVVGPRSRGETTHGKRLSRSLHAGMIVLLDRGFSSNAFLATASGTQAAFLARLSAARKPPVLHRFADGSFLSRIGALEVRIIECEMREQHVHTVRQDEGASPHRPAGLAQVPGIAQLAWGWRGLGWMTERTRDP